MAVNTGSSEYARRVFRVNGQGDASWLDSMDEGWIDDAGVLYIEGRRDADLKIGGVRVDVMGIEERILAISGVEEVSVVGIQRVGNRDTDILGIAIVAKPLVIDSVREFLLSAQGPERNAFVQEFKSLPKNQSLKTDRHQVVESLRDRMESVSVKGPEAQGDVESVISDCWESVLEIERPPRDAPMAVFGADSLLRLRIILELEARHRLTIPASKIGICHTIQEQAAAVRVVDDDVPGDFLIPLSNHEADIHIVCVPGLGGHAWIFDLMLKAFGSEYAGYGVDWCHRDLPGGRKRWSELAERIGHASADKEVFLLGFSAGGSVAWAIAEACEKIGVPVRGVIAMDGAPARGWRDLMLKMRRWRRILREKSDVTPASEHIGDLRRRGERVLRTIRNTPLVCPCLEITSEESPGGAYQWNMVSGECELHQLPGGHLDVVRQPIDQEMCGVTRSWMHACIEAPEDSEVLGHDQFWGKREWKDSNLQPPVS